MLRIARGASWRSNSLVVVRKVQAHWPLGWRSGNSHGERTRVPWWWIQLIECVAAHGAGCPPDDGPCILGRISCRPLRVDLPFDSIRAVQDSRAAAPGRCVIRSTAPRGYA